MLDIGWTEILTVVVLAVLVIGPRDLPKAMRGVAKTIGKVKSMLRQFQNELDTMLRDSELDEVKNQIQATRNFNVKDQVGKALDPDSKIQSALDPAATDEKDKPADTNGPKQ